MRWRMAARIFLTSGAERVIDGDDARLEGACFLICRSRRIVLTLPAANVVAAQVEDENSAVTAQVLGAGLPEKN